MAYYLYQVTYTREAWAAQLQNPQNVADRTRASVEELGGSIVGVWYAFGESDLIGVVEMPDNVSMAALAMAFAAGGAVSAAKTTVLMSLEDGLAAMSKAAASSYQPPTQQLIRLRGRPLFPDPLRGRLCLAWDLRDTR